MRIQLSSSDSASVWKGLKEITNYKTPSPSTVENQQLTDNLNEFYCRFEKTPHTRSEHLSTQPLTPPATPLSPTPAVQSSEYDMCQVFRSIKKAPGPDCLWTSARPLILAFQTSSCPNYLSSPCPHLSVSGSPPSWQSGSSLWSWENTHPALILSVLELIRAVFSPHWCSPCTPMTAHLKNLCQAPEVCRRHHTYWPHSGRWRVYLQTRGWAAGCLVQS